MTPRGRAGHHPHTRPGIDLAAALNLVGSLIKYLGPASLVPAVFAVAHDEPAWPFLAAGAIVSGAGLALERLTHGAEEVRVREGYLVTCLTWLIAAGYGALPYVLAGDPQLGRPVDAFFEGMSGFTTTGASVATDVSALPVSIQVWRQLTIWLGGIGVVALGLAVLPRLRVGGRQLLESELAGPGIDALSSRIRDTVRRFATLYAGLTVAGFLALAVPGWLGARDVMDTYQAFAHTLSTLGTGGFSTEQRSIGAFGALTQWTVVVFMAVAGTNFLVLHRALIQRRSREALRDEELRLYVTILLVAGAAVAAIVWADGPQHGGAAIRAGVFEVTSVVTTTGYFTVDYGGWPLFALMALALLFFVGGCAGSTSGSIKVVRHLLLARLLGREVVRTAHPELVRPLRLNGAIVDQQTLLAVISFVLIYVAVFVLGTAVLALDGVFAGRPRMDALGLVF
ncbi:MAG TPA: TrkH family potassium uptake protein, partial [Solirubrobacteraceae bacterium]|nr:TrkH family potassium uptake protein [Solirubrobacteraceae bacterium]